MKGSSSTLGLILLVQSAVAAEGNAPETRLRRKLPKKSDEEESAPFALSEHVACHILKKGTWEDKDDKENDLSGHFRTVQGATESDVALPDGANGWQTSFSSSCYRICKEPNLMNLAFKHHIDGDTNADCAPKCVFDDVTGITGHVAYECLTQAEKAEMGTTLHPPPVEINKGEIVHVGQEGYQELVEDEEKDKVKKDKERVEGDDGTTAAPEEGDEEAEEEEEEEGTTEAPAEEEEGTTEAPAEEEEAEEEVEGSTPAPEPEMTLCHIKTLGNGERKFKTVTGTMSELKEKGLWQNSYAESCEYCCDDTGGMLNNLCPDYMEGYERCQPRCKSDEDEGGQVDDDGYVSKKCAYDVQCPLSGEEKADEIIMGAPGVDQMETADGDLVITKKICYYDSNNGYFYTVHVEEHEPVDVDCNGIAGHCALDGACEGHCDNSLHLICTQGGPVECKKLKDEGTAEGSKVFECNYNP